VTPTGTGGVLNDGVSIHFADATFAGAIVGQWCVERYVKLCCDRPDLVMARAAATCAFFIPMRTTVR
jgi:hypothetical protein